MSVTSPDAGNSFSIGNVLNRAFQICSANFVTFFAVTFVISLPNLFFLLRAPTVGAPQFDTASLTSFVLAILLGLVLNTIGQAVILYGAFQALRGQPVRLGEALQKGLARFFPILGLALLYGLCIGFGFVLLIVPGVILFVIWAVVLPACVVEGLGPIESMGRSSRLTKGHRWKIFWMMVLLTVVSAIVAAILNLLLVPAGLVVKAVGSLLWTAFWSAYWNCVLVMIYHDLRVAKEGVDTAQIASVFD